MQQSGSAEKEEELGCHEPVSPVVFQPGIGPTFQVPPLSEYKKPLLVSNDAFWTVRPSAKAVPLVKARNATNALQRKNFSRVIRAPA
jgi:hypothetical protein